MVRAPDGVEALYDFVLCHAEGAGGGDVEVFVTAQVVVASCGTSDFCGPPVGFHRGHPGIDGQAVFLVAALAVVGTFERQPRLLKFEIATVELLVFVMLVDAFFASLHAYIHKEQRE